MRRWGSRQMGDDARAAPGMQHLAQSHIPGSTQEPIATTTTRQEQDSRLSKFFNFLEQASILGTTHTIDATHARCDTYEFP
jgi:hypothetical protein